MLHAFPDSDNIVSTSVADAIICLNPKLSRGIDGIHALHLKNGGPPFLEHLMLLMQMIFTQGLVLSTFCVGDLSPILKKKRKSSN